jgi:hypothetical protein
MEMGKPMEKHISFLFGIQECWKLIIFGAKRSENKNDLVGMLVISRWGMGDVDPHTLGSQTCIPLLGESAKKKTLDDLK